MKLCFFGIGLTYKGGVENYSVNLLKHIAQSDDVDEILVLCDDIDEEASASLRHKKINVIRIGHVKGDSIRIMFRNLRYNNLTKDLKKFQIFHTLDYRALPFLNIKTHPLVVTIHNIMKHEFLMQLKATRPLRISNVVQDVDHYFPQAFLEFLSVMKADRILVNSLVIAERLGRLYGHMEGHKTQIIPAGFDSEKFNPFFMRKSDAKKFLKLDSSAKVLLHIGAWERKGLVYLLNALNYIQKTGQLDQSNILLLMLGKMDEKYRQPFSSIEKHVVELPYVKQDALPIVYRAADALIMPSTSEGWGMALVEALACGTPVVASSHVPSALATEGTGVVRIEKEIQNAPQLAHTILDVLTDDSLETKEWNKIFDFLSQNYSWENYSSSLLRVYRGLIN